jgi:hypothetical protein
MRQEDLKEAVVAQNLKPILEEIKNKLANTNKEQLRDAVLENLKQTRQTVEKTLKQVAEQSKDSRLVREYVIPFAESENADKAMKFLNAKLGSNPLVSKIEQARKSLIDLKVADAKPAEAVTTVEEKTPEADA